MQRVLATASIQGRVRLPCTTPVEVHVKIKIPIVQAVAREPIGQTTRQMHLSEWKIGTRQSVERTGISRIFTDLQI